MIPVRGLVTVLTATRGDRGGGGFDIRNGCGRDVMRSPEELGRLKEHFDDMFVAVIAGGNPRVIGKEEDVHPAVVQEDRGWRGQFFTRGR